MYCDQCGKSIVPDARYCQQCGSAVAVLDSGITAPFIPEVDADTSSSNMFAAETQGHAPTLPVIGSILHAWRSLDDMGIRYRHVVAEPMTWTSDKFDVGISDQYIFFCPSPGNTKTKEYLDKFGDKWKYVALLGSGGGLLGAGIATAIAMIPWLAASAFEEGKGKKNTLSQDELANYYSLGLLAYADKSSIKVELFGLPKGWFAPQLHIAYFSGHFTTINGEVDIQFGLSDYKRRGALDAILAVNKGLMAANVKLTHIGGAGVTLTHVWRENNINYPCAFKNGEFIIIEDFLGDLLKEK